jgi:hypothetical protein
MEITRFDEIEFQIINCGKTGGYYLSEEHGERALLMMEQGILHPNPKSNWHVSGWKLTDYGKEYYDVFLAQVHANHGHVWMTNRDSNPDIYDDDDEYGNSVNIFAYSVGYHNGMQCKNCGFSFCEHCDSEMEIEPCRYKK